MKNCPRCKKPTEYPGTTWVPLLCPACSTPLQRFKKPSAVPDVEGLEILADIGHGGMGKVYLARERRLRRLVAVKFIAGSGHSELVERFRREAETAASLDHEHILPVYSLQSDDGFACYTMPYVAGPSLAQVIRWAERLDDPDQLWRVLLLGDQAESSSDTGPGRFADSHAGILNRVCHAFIDLSDALHAVHSAGLLHRDVKPGNILIAPDGRFILGDFGLVRALGDTRITSPGQAIGTPYCMSPEQVLAGKAEMDHRTDVYSLGVCLYTALTLRRPFSARNLESLFRAIMTKIPTSPRTLDHRIPRDLDAIVMQALAKDADKRYESARAMAADVTHFLHFEPVTARPVTWHKRLALRARRHKRAMAAVAAIAAIVFGVFSSGFHHRRVEEIENRVRARELVHEARLEARAADRARGLGVLALESGARIEAVAWKQRADELTRSALSKVEEASSRGGDSDDVQRLGTELRVRRLIHAAQLARRRLRFQEAEQKLEQARFEARGHEDLVAEAMSAEPTLQVTLDPDIEKVFLRSPQGASKIDLVQGVNDLPVAGLYELHVLDRFGERIVAPIAIGPPGVEGQRIDVPISPRRLRLFPDFVLIPGSICFLGEEVGMDEDSYAASTNTNRARWEFVPAFLMARNEVTNREYRRLLIDRRGFEAAIEKARSENPLVADRGERGPWTPAGWRNKDYPRGEDDMPVRGLGIIEAHAFAAWKDARLPRADEWEKTARAGKATPYPIGNGELIDRFEARSFAAIRAVATRIEDQGPYGVNDILANVVEWTSHILEERERSTSKIAWMPVAMTMFWERPGRPSTYHTPRTSDALGIRLARDIPPAD